MNKYKFEIETVLNERPAKIQLLSCEFLASNVKEANVFSQSLYSTWAQSIQNGSPKPIRVINLYATN
jgi:hypothetical protein